MIYWNADQFKVGIEAIDRQHMALFQAVNQLHESYQKGTGQTQMTELFLFLQDYTQTHFAEEEQLMEAYDYPERDTQKLQHSHFIEELAELKRNLDAEGPNMKLTVALFSKISNWLAEHISIEDRKMGEYVKARMQR